MALKLILFLLLITCIRKSLSDTPFEYVKFIRPIYYDLHLIMAGTTELRDYNGVLKVKFEALTDSNYLQIKTTTTTNITYVKLTNLNTSSHVASEISTKRYGYNDADTSYSFKVNETFDIIKKMQVYELEFNFTRHLHHHYAEKAVIMAKYNTDNMTKYFAFTRFQAEFYLHIMPIHFDELLLKAPIKLRISHQPQYRALSNMPGHVIAGLNDVVTTEFDVTPPMPVHLLAFVVGEFQSTPVPYSRFKPFHLHGSSEVLLKSGDAVVMSGIILNGLEIYLQVPYTLPKMDYVIVPKSEDDRGLEPWGLVLVQESEFFTNTKTIKTVVFMQNTILNARLLSRQYFGNLITPKDWKYYWLTQSFSTFFSYFILDNEFTHDNYIDQFIVDNMFKTFEECNDSGNVTSVPIDMSYWYVNHIKINEYKMSSTIRMLQHMVGADTFQTATTRYITQNAYGFTTPDDLIEAFDTVLKQDSSWPSEIKIGAVINSWINNNGLPMLTVTRNYENQNVVLEQSYGGTDDNYKSQKWWIAYNYASKSKPDFNDTKPMGWLKNESSITQNLNLPPNEWIIFNKQYTNLYPVNYDQRNWNLILDELVFGDFERIHVYNRAQIIKDLYQLVQWGKADRKLLVKSLFYLRREKEYLPWVTVNTVLDNFWKTIKFTRKASTFRKFLKHITGTSYDHYRLNSQPNESNGELITRTILIKWACFAGYNNCLRDMDALSATYLSSLNTSQTLYVHPNIKDDLFCYGFQNEDKYNQAFEYFLAHADHPDEPQFFQQFRCRSNTAVFRKYYFLFLDKQYIPYVKSEYPAYDKVAPVIGYPMFQENAVDILYQCLLENCYDFKKNYPATRIPYEIEHRFSFVFLLRLYNENDLPTIRLLLNRIEEVYGNETIKIIGSVGNFNLLLARTF